MSDDVVIRAEGLGKKYLIGHQAERQPYYALRDVMAKGARTAWRKAADLARGRALVSGDRVEEFWALRDVSFEVKRGEVLGIIGRNGAGKSTLLKILSRITEPSAGRVEIEGRVASLLEVGTGFHPELTGRENIYLNGSILGMSRAEIRKKFDEIVAFAEVERFLDTPVKRYSSGMYVRLAFAVAAHLEPEILVVDEVLAVGDAEFQKKCLGKMDEVSRREGRTVLFVSHNMGIVGRLCPAAVWLHGGSLREAGPTTTVIGRYLAHGDLNRDRIINLNGIKRPSFVADGRVRLESLEWLSGWPLLNGDNAKARIVFKIDETVRGLSIGLGFSTLGGVRLLTYETDFTTGFRPDFIQPGYHWVETEILSLPLAPDVYALDIGCRSGESYPVDYLPGCAQIDIGAGPRTPRYILRPGAGVRLESCWSWSAFSAANSQIHRNANRDKSADDECIDSHSCETRVRFGSSACLRERNVEVPETPCEILPRVRS